MERLGAFAHWTHAATETWAQVIDSSPLSACFCLSRMLMLACPDFDPISTACSKFVKIACATYEV